MKKSTILVIVIVYLVSIVAIAFFGMKSKVDNEVKYIKEISMDIRADDESAYEFKQIGTIDQNKLYQLTIDFSKAIDVKVERENGIIEMRKCVYLTFIPNISYDTGDTANAEEESIVYSVSDKSYIQKEYVSLNDRGELLCYRNNISFQIFVNPESIGSMSAGIVINVYVMNV